MKDENARAMERMSLFCHISGLISVFMGLVVSFMELLTGVINRTPVGLYVFMSGYALVKISSKLARIVFDERTHPSSNY